MINNKRALAQALLISQVILGSKSSMAADALTLEEKHVGRLGLVGR